jgi:hypothetical protein
MPNESPERSQLVCWLTPVEATYAEAKRQQKEGFRCVYDDLYEKFLEANVPELYRPRPRTVRRKLTLEWAYFRMWLRSWNLFGSDRAPSIYYDFVPSRAGTCTLFVLCNGLMSRWQYRNNINVAGNISENLADWSRQESWKTDWSEPFYVHQTASTFFFITESGRLYTIKKNEARLGAKPSQLKVRPKPLVALLFVPAADQAYVFGTDFMLELKDGSQPTPCKNILAGESNIGPVLGTLRNCASAVKSSAQQK